MKFLRSVLVAGVTLALAVPSFAQNIVLNPSFETPDIGGDFSTYGAGSSNLTNWTINSGGLDHINSLWVAQDGGQSLDMNSTSPATISQVLNTTPGQQYLISFFIAGNTAGSPTIKTLRATFGATSVDENFNITGFSNSNMGWSNRTFLATATSATTTLSFQSLITGSFGPALDNVSVTAVTSSAAPEPASVGLALLGLGALAVRRRK